MKRNHAAHLHVLPAQTTKPARCPDCYHRATVSRRITAVLDTLCYLTLLTCLVIGAAVLAAMV